VSEIATSCLRQRWALLFNFQPIMIFSATELLQLVGRRYP